LGYFNLPISELPNIDFPTLVVNASLPGANPDTMATSVATPIEKQLSTVPGIDSMNSVSTAGSTNITLQFTLDRNIDAAAQDVQTALLQAAKKLPSQMPSPPTIRKVNPAESPVLYLALTADNIPLTKLDDYAENYLSPSLSTLEGVAQVNVFGSQQYAVRIHVNPNAMKSRDLGLTDIKQAVQAANSNEPTGTLQTAGSYNLIKTDGALKNAQQFSNAIISFQNGAPIKLGDIARVEDSVANDKAETWYNNQRSIVLAIQREPGSNTITVISRILQLLPTLEKQMPGGTQIHILYNRGTFIKAAVNDVEMTLLFSVLLVVLVVYLFLQNISFTVIAALSLPISVIATFAVMYLLDDSLDNLSLMALVLVVGFIIDDAIVVLENIVRYVDQGVDRMTASLKATQEVSFTVIAMTLSLAAVFLPIFFMGGIIGRLFHEFAAVVAIAILFSAFIALTLIPMLCSRFIRAEASMAKQPSKFMSAFIKSRLLYESSLRWSLDHCATILSIAGVLVIAIILLFYLVPKGFIPSEDTGIVFGNVQAPQGITYPDFAREQNLAKKIMMKNTNVANISSNVGQSANASGSGNTGRFIIQLKPHSQNVNTVIQQLTTQLQAVAGLKIILTNPAAINIGGKSTSGNYQFVLQSMSWDSLKKAADILQAQLAKIPGMDGIDTDVQFNNPELNLHILKQNAAAFGITSNAIESTLYLAYGEQKISSILAAEGDYNVIMDIDPNYQHSITSLDILSLKSPTTGQMIPLSSLVTITRGAGPLAVNHYGQLPAIVVSFNLKPGAALGDIVNQVQAIAATSLPTDVTGSFTGTAQKFQQSLSTLPLLLGFTILIIYMILAILYESFIHPLTILTAIPFAIFGALFCLYLFDQELDIFSFIGLIMLVGITKKNGIIMIDFALQAQRQHALDAKQSILQACSIRFRPIMMTTVCAVITAIPIALGIGSGGETRRGLGIAIAGGLIFSQLITLYITPVFYILMDRFVPKKKALMSCRH